MEQQNQAANDNITPQDPAVNNNKFMCRQSSSRWTPTTDQIRILKELYYTNGMRSPTAEQIQRISARLRQYGKIEGKNVFYWFQNHKARERQKKRFTSDQQQQQIHYNVVMQRSSALTAPSNASNNSTANATNPAATFHQQQEFHHHHAFHRHHVKYSNLSPVNPGGSTSSASFVGVNGQMGNYSYGYAGVANLEKAFREQCGSGGSIAQNFGWVGSVDPYSSPYTLIDKRSMIDDENDHDLDRGEEDFNDQGLLSPEIETLPLFPMHGEDIISGGGYYSGWYASDEARSCHVIGSRASLELTLNSYGDSL